MYVSNSWLLNVTNQPNAFYKYCRDPHADPGLQQF